MTGLQRRTGLGPGKPLERRTPLKGGVPLQRGAGLKPGKPLERREKAPRSPLRARPARKGNGEISARQIVTSRSGSVCEAGCGRPATDCAHRKPRSALGPWAASNLLHLCAEHHRWQHAHPDEAVRLGLHLKSWQDPATTPVHLAGSWWLLDDHGGRTPAEAVA